MKILIVEDDGEYVRAIQREVSELNTHAIFTVAASLASAREHLADAFFDLIFLDLKLPTVDGAVDEEPEHGHAVFTDARRLLPGTPIFVLTGSPAEPFIEKLIGHTQQVDVWGDGKIPSVQFLAKFRFGTEFRQAVTPYLRGFDGIFEVELDRGTVDLSPQEHRLIRIFSTRRRAVKCDVRQLSGGLSGVKVLRLKLTDVQGAPMYDCVCKIASRDVVFDESNRFDAHISRLDPKATPRKLDVLEYGAGDVCGIFYGLAAGFESDAFAVAAQNDDACAELVCNLETLTAPWRQGVPQTRKLIREIRASCISDDKFSGLRASIPHKWIEEFEQRAVQVINGCGHCDLHGLNVLVSPPALAILIDYGDVGPCSACVDPITLELSLFFHPNGPLRDSVWPSPNLASEWGDLSAYLVGSPMPRFISECRSWALRSAAGKREMAAVAFAYLARQLKYPGSDRVRIFALMAGAKDLFDSAT